MSPWRFGRSTFVEKIEVEKSQLPGLMNDSAGAHPSFRSRAANSHFGAGAQSNLSPMPSKLYVRAYRWYVCVAVFWMTPISSCSESRASRATSSLMDILSGLENGMDKFIEGNRNDPAPQFRAVGSYHSDGRATTRWLCSRADRQFRGSRRPPRRRGNRSVDYSPLR